MSLDNPDRTISSATQNDLFDNAEQTSPKSPWVKLFDDKSQRHYYINEQTSETTWDLPHEVKKRMSRSEDVSAGMNQPVDENSSEYFNTVSTPINKRIKMDQTVSQETKPFAFDALDKERSSNEQSAMDAMQQNMSFYNNPANWRTAIDHDSGRQYHYNIHTKQTQWANPGEMLPVIQMNADYNYHAQLTGRRRRRSMKEMQDAWDRGDRVGLWECPDCSKILTEGSKKTHPDSCNARKARSVHMVQGTPSDILAGAHWRAVQDENGQTYYYHQITKQTSWFKPNEMQNFEQYQQNQEIIQNSLGTSSAGLNQWTEVTDSSGRVYYFNNITGTTCWNKPAETMEQQSNFNNGNTQREEEIDTSGEWIEVIDSKSGNKYYYNNVTKKTSWTNPLLNGANPTSAEATQNEAGKATESPSKSDQLENKEGALSGSNSLQDGETESSKDALDSSFLEGKNGLNRDSALGDESLQTRRLNENPLEMNETPSLYSGYSDWHEAIDQSSGRKYYYNVRTNETNWEMPERLLCGANQETQWAEKSQKNWEESSEPMDSMGSDGWIKIFDKKTQRFYYHHPMSNKTTWDAPNNFVETDSNVLRSDVENGENEEKSQMQTRGMEEDEKLSQTNKVQT